MQHATTLVAMNAIVGRVVSLVAGACVAAALASACSSGDPNETTRPSVAALIYDSDNGGYCASNPSAQCDHGTPVGPKQLIFTFDDGPASQTLALSSYLHAQGIRAAFFVNGRNFSGNAASVLSQLVADGHLVGNHTQNHRDLTTLDDATILSEVVDTDEIIAPYVPSGHFLFDAPFGGWDAHVHSVLHASAMDKYVGPVKFDIGGQMTSLYGADWDCWQNQSGYGVQTTKQCGDRYLREIADVGRGIILLHDADYGDVANHSLTSGKGNTIDMVKYLVEGDAASGVKGLKALGYTFIREDEVPDIAAAFSSSTDGGSGGSCAFDPTWSQTSYANEWWVEYAITGNVTSASLSVVGGATVTLSSSYGKWVGPTGVRIPKGTQVILHATNATGGSAATQPFPYLVTAAPSTACDGGSGVDSGGGCVPNCTGRTCGGDGCGGSCGTCAAGQVCTAGACVSSCSSSFDPTWTQTSYANEWWVEYAISGNVTSASLSVVGGGTVPLSSSYGKWVGPTDARIPKATQVILHATNALGESAATVPFAYLVTTTPSTAATTCDAGGGGGCVPSCAGHACGDDGCGGSCGTCAAGQSCSAGACVSSCTGATFSATWTQTSYANEWWIEYVIGTSTTVSSAYLQIEGGPTVALSSKYGKWIGPTSVRIPRGTPVAVHAENTLGQHASTSPFGYLDVTAPATAPCSN